MIDNIKIAIRDSIVDSFNTEFNKEVNVVIEKPKNPENGDLSIPVFGIVKALGMPLPEVASRVKTIVESFEVVKEVNVAGGFLNVKFAREAIARGIVDSIKENYGTQTDGQGKMIVIDYSAPNIAKDFGIGHLRSTIIGHSLIQLYKKMGYSTFGINYLGDWGTQFGKLIYAYRNWVDMNEFEQNPIKELMRIYVLFHQEAELDPTLEDRGREEFKKLEQGDAENLALWNKFREFSLLRFQMVYDRLGVTFDSYNGESFYEDKMAAVIRELEDKNLLVEDQGASIVDLGEDFPPALIKKNDGSTLYLTRDLASFFYRLNNYHFHKALYVVGGEQALHFKQLKEVLTKMGYAEKANDIEHINFGLYLMGGKKMSTRKGKRVQLDDVLTEARDLALSYIEEKNPMLENKEEIAERIGVSAIIFNDLKNDRTNNIEFDMDNMVKFEGQTGPYLQYTTVRIKSILKQNNFVEGVTTDAAFYTNEYAFELIKELAEYPNVIKKATNENAPHHVSKYLLSLASLFNSYYANEKVNVEHDLERNSKLLLLNKVLLVLESGFDLLGMKTVERM